MKAIPAANFSSKRAPKEYEGIPELKSCRPKVGGKDRYVEVSLQQLDYPKSVIMVQWMGAKNGLWYPASDVFRIMKK